MTYYIYRHIRKDTNEPFYIGKGTIRNISRGVGIGDFKKHYFRAFRTDGRNKYWKSIVEKTDYNIDILYEDDDQDEIYEKEKEFIKLYGRKDMGEGTLINLTNGGGGECGRIFTKEHLRKISVSLTGRKGISYYGKDNPNYGKPLYGKDNHFYGKKHKPETIRNQIIVQSFPVEVTLPDNEILYYECVNDCAEYFNCTKENIYHHHNNRLKGKTPRFGKFRNHIIKIIK